MTKAAGTPAQVFARGWDDLEDSPAEAATMRMRSELMIPIRQSVAARSTTPAAAARRLARAGLDVPMQIETAQPAGAMRPGQ